MRLMDLSWAVISFLETLDGFVVVFTRSRKTRDQTLGGLVLDCVLQVHQLFFLGNGRSIVNRDTELLPEVFPSQNVTMEGW